MKDKKPRLRFELEKPVRKKNRYPTQDILRVMAPPYLDENKVYRNTWTQVGRAVITKNGNILLKFQLLIKPEGKLVLPKAEHEVGRPPNFKR